MVRLKIVAWIVLVSTAAYAQKKIDRKLSGKVEQLFQNFQGQAGVYIINLRSNKIVSINADTLFPTASMIKIPILIGIMDKLESKQLDYHQEMIYNDSLLYAGVDILGSFKSGEKIELSKVMMLMLTMSDNTASLWLQSLAGGGTRINELLDSMGLKFTRVNSRTPGRETNRTAYGWGVTTPKEMAELMEKIYYGNVISKKASDKMLRLLSRNYWDEVAASQVPPTVMVASKNGAVNESRSETVLVMAQQGPYIFSVITKNIKDQSWQPGNEAWTLIRSLSRLLWNYFEPRSKWKPE